MSGELHEMSAAIGRLQASIEEERGQRRDLWEKLDEINGKLTCLPPLVEKVRKIEPTVAGLARVRERQIGAAAAVAALISAFGWLAGWLFK